MLEHLHGMAADRAVPLRITGGCMAPLVEENAVVLVKKQRLYWPGDIVVFGGSAGSLQAHRLIGMYPRRGRLRCLTQADNGSRPDPSILRQSILGRVTGGDCRRESYRVPLRHRVLALKRFARFLAVGVRS
jgi:hypothetical protein